MFLLSLGHIAFVLCLLFAGATQAYACATTWPETLFFDVIPEKLLDADVIAKVSLLTDVSKYPSPGMEEELGAGAVSVVQIIKTSDARLHPDEKIAIKVDPMTCSYIDHDNGDEGIIIAKARSDAEGRLVLCLYTRNLLNRHITPPSAYECLPDEVQATDQTRLAAEKGDAKAQVDLGLIYERGHEVRKNNEEAMKWYKRAAESGDAAAQCMLGQRYLREENCEEAVKLFELAADQGYVYAMTSIGDMYRGWGKCLEKNDAKVRQWYTRAAEGGYDLAQLILGRMYKNGEHGKRNDAEAVKWLRLAAAQTNAYAVSELEEMYRKGRGATKKDADKSHWLQIAAENGDVKAQLEYGQQCLVKYQNDSSWKDVKNVENVKEAAKYYELAAAQGHVGAMYNLGKIYYGYDVWAIDESMRLQNKAKAVEWFTRAAEHGHIFAQSELGRLYQEGRDVKQDDAEAVKWFRLAAAQGDHHAADQLKKMYLQGREATKDDANADADEAKLYWF